MKPTLEQRVAMLEGILDKIMKPDRFIFENPIAPGALGLNIGTKTTDKISLYGAVPVAQHSASGVTDQSIVGGTAVHASDQFGNGAGGNYYTISDIVAALEALGILK